MEEKTNYTKMALGNLVSKTVSIGNMYIVQLDETTCAVQPSKGLPRKESQNNFLNSGLFFFFYK